MFCEYCENEAVADDEVLGAVCAECLERAESNQDEYGIYAVGIEEDYDLILDARALDR